MRTEQSHTYKRGELADVAGIHGEFTAVRVLGRTRDDGHGHRVWVKVTAHKSRSFRHGEIVTVTPSALWPRKARYYVAPVTGALPVVDSYGNPFWQCTEGDLDHILSAHTMAWLMDRATDLIGTGVVEVDWREPLDGAKVREVTVRTRTPSGRESVRTFVLPA